LPRAKEGVATVGAGAVLLGCALASFSQLQYWRNGETLFRHALAVTRDNPVAEYGLAKVLVKAGRVQEGLQHLEQAVALSPQYVSALTKIADLQVSQGRIQEAIDRYRQVLRCSPDMPEVLNNLAWLLATSDDPALRNGTEAVRLAERACQLTQYETAGYIDTLAAAYAEAGQFDDAFRTAERAIARALKSGQKELADRIKQALELYRAGKPLHQRL
jgi:tetratricopeptide (TPR) repeat protein